MKLYWCETIDHDEDWFVVASSAKEACGIHENAEGYEKGEAQAILVCQIPPHLDPPLGWPDHDLLLALGAVFISEQTSRVVQIGEKTYPEGGIDAVIDRVSDDHSEALGQGRPNKTSRLM
ncbi:MAG: hypothetical protein AB7G75_28525 [Candidatus Binatia bacterium]